MSTQASSFKIGLGWVISSLQLFRQNPGKWLLLALCYVLLFIVLPGIPQIPALIGLLIILIWPSFLSLAIGLYREADQGRDTELGDLAASIKPYLPKLVALGGLCLVYGILVNWLHSGDSQMVSELVKQKADPREILTHALPVMIKTLLLITPLLMATWFSPMLIAYQQFSVLKAIQHSIWASWKMLLPMGFAWLVLTFGLILVMLLLGIIAGLLSTISAAFGTILMSLALLLSLLVVTNFLLAIQYFSYRHVYYHPPEPLA